MVTLRAKLYFDALLSAGACLQKLRAAVLPPVFMPWVYLGPGRLADERRRWLAALPAHRTEQLGEGWVVQAVPDLLTRPGLDFLERLRDGAGIEYRQV